MPISDSSRSNCFYSRGPYNDTWETDIYLTNPFLQSKSLSYYPIKNSVLSFRTNHKTYGFEEQAPVFVDILGLNFKKLKVDYQNWQFYGYE